MIASEFGGPTQLIHFGTKISLVLTSKYTNNTATSYPFSILPYSIYSSEIEDPSTAVIDAKLTLASINRFDSSCKANS